LDIIKVLIVCAGVFLTGVVLTFLMRLGLALLFAGLAAFGVYLFATGNWDKLLEAFATQGAWGGLSWLVSFFQR